ncbi:TonB-dependent receptor domain-containing protein [Stappia sp.]|uniref:TonB-dependent receptor plug domain-containing protein n=1 Tax=Stappia sp. TaxID=1870903 RepID=UPI0032D94372
MSATTVIAEEIDLDAVVVSAGRTPVAAEAVGRAHTVITGTELEETQTRYVADALRRVPGLAVSRTGAAGGVTQIRVRGSEANHVLVLIDGVEVSASSSGEYDLGGLLAEDIDRIEVLRGPQSALYGSNAMAGVISITTKGGLRNDLRITGRAEGGTDGTRLGAASVRGGGETFDIAVSAAFRENDGFNLSDFGSEKDGGHNGTLNGKLNWDITDALTFDWSARYVDRKTATDDQDFRRPDRPTQGLVIDTLSNSENREFFTGAGLSWTLFDDRLVQKARVEYTDIERRDYNAVNGSPSGNEDQRIHASYQATGTFRTDFLEAEHSLTAALEWERESFKSAFPATPAQVPTQSRDLVGYVAEYRGAFLDRVFVSAGLRYDQNEAFKDSVTYSASAAYKVHETGTRFHASVGTGVTNPTFYEQFGFNPGRFNGNPNLKPEESFGWDIGVEQRLWNDRLTLDVTYFRERLENEITTTFPPPTFIGTPVNLNGTSKRQGVEVAMGLEVLDNLFVKGSYTYLDATDPSGTEEVRRPKHSGAFGVIYGFNEGRGNVFLDAVYNGRMFDNEFVNATPRTRVKLDDYLLVNVGADYRVAEHVTLFGRIENLLDTNYEEIYGYNTAGITAYAGVKATF